MLPENPPRVGTATELDAASLGRELPGNPRQRGFHHVQREPKPFEKLAARRAFEVKIFFDVTPRESIKLSGCS